MKDIIIILLILSLLFGIMIYKCSHNEDLIHYGDDNYYFVSVAVNQGKRGLHYWGTISKEDYQKWVDGYVGTVWINSPKREGHGYRINIYNIITITNYGSAPNWLPLNFRMR